MLWMNQGQFRFLRAACFGLVNLKGSVGLILAKTSAMRISTPLDLSSRLVIQQPSFIRSRCQTPLLDPSLVFSPPCSVEHGGVFLTDLSVFILIIVLA